MTHTYKTNGTCSRTITFDLEDGIVVLNVHIFVGEVFVKAQSDSLPVILIIGDMTNVSEPFVLLVLQIVHQR